MTENSRPRGAEEEVSEVTVFGADYWRAHTGALSEALTNPQDSSARRKGVLRIVDLATGPAAKLAFAAGAVLLGVSAVIRPQQQRLTLTVEEAAERLGISRALAYEAVRRNEIPHIKIGRRILVQKAALDKLLDSVSPPEEDEAVGE